MKKARLFIDKVVACNARLGNEAATLAISAAHVYTLSESVRDERDRLLDRSGDWALAYTEETFRPCDGHLWVEWPVFEPSLSYGFEYRFEGFFLPSSDWTPSAFDAGWPVVYYTGGATAGMYSDIKEAAFDFCIDKSSKTIVPQSAPEFDLSEKSLRYLGSIVNSTLMLINTPKATKQVMLPRKHKRHPRSLRRLQITVPRQRVRQVELNVDVARGGLTSAEKERRRVALHHVRGHLRLVGRKFVPVRPHWRGSPELGVVHQVHNVRKQDDAS